jgi:hypothetical protein
MCLCQAAYQLITNYIIVNPSDVGGENQILKFKEMKNKIKLFLLFIILSFAIISCYPLNQSRYGDQGNRDQGNRSQGDRHHRHQQDYRDQGDRNHYSPME